MSSLGRWQRWSREPLVRFLLLGLAVLGIDRMLAGPGTAASARIVVPASQQAAARAAFRAAQGREPDAAELEQALSGWVDEQLLYREALARGLDRGDAIVRRQLVQKMRFLLEVDDGAAEPSDAELREWHAAHAARYAMPATTSFQQVFLGRARHGAALEEDAAAVGRQLARAPEQFAQLGDPFPTTAFVHDADDARVRREFGAGFADALAGLQPGAWVGPVASAFGLHYVRVTARAPARPLPLESVRARVRADWQGEHRDAARRAALDRLRRHYRVELEPRA